MKTLKSEGKQRKTNETNKKQISSLNTTNTALNNKTKHK